MEIELKTKIWLESGGERLFGDGPFDILARIEQTGSLKASADQINMSYSQAWHLIRMIENNLGYPVLKRQAGGTGGGHSTLTPKATRLMKAYREFRLEADKELTALYHKHLTFFTKSNK